MLQDQLIDTSVPFIERSFFRDVNPGDTNRSWDTTIVASDNEAHQLPRMIGFLSLFSHTRISG